MNTSGTQMSARAVADLLASIFGPSFYDGPRFGRNISVLDLVSMASDRANAVMLNPQPLPPREFHAVALADAHIHELLALDRAGSLMGGEVLTRALNKALRQLADLDETCPRWPRWPKVWPPPPPPPWSLEEEMNRTELFLFGSRFLAASSVTEEGRIEEALVKLGEKALGLSTQGA